MLNHFRKRLNKEEEMEYLVGRWRRSVATRIPPPKFKLHMMMSRSQNEHRPEAKSDPQKVKRMMKDVEMHSLRLELPAAAYCHRQCRPQRLECHCVQDFMDRQDP